MNNEQVNLSSMEKSSFDYIFEKAEKYLNNNSLKEAVISIGSDVNSDPNIDDFQKKVIVGLSMEYQAKPDLSREDIDVFANYVKHILE